MVQCSRVRGTAILALAAVQLAGTFATQLCVYAAQAPQLWYTKPATQWSEALPIGNGRLAAMVFGGIGSERLQLNEETIYAGKQMDRVNPEARANLSTIRTLLLTGRVLEAQALAKKTMLAIPERQPPYEPFGDLTLSFEGHNDLQVSSYRRSLNLYDGLFQIDYDANGIHYSRTAFASYPDNVIVVHLSANKSRALSFTVSLSRQEHAQAVLQKWFGERVIVLRGTAFPPVGKYDQEPQTGTAFTGVVSVVSNGRSTVSGENKIRIANASEATLVFTAATDARGGNPGAKCKQQMQRATRRSYRDLLARHTADFRRLATRVSLTLGDSESVVRAVPTDELVNGAKQGGDDGALVSLYFAFGRYLLQSSSRENSLPANLQGKWNDQIDPPWGSKYTININTEMNYWPAEICNLGETVRAVDNLFDVLRPGGERTAREMYGTSGLVAHHNTDGWGDTEPIDGVPYGIWPFGAAWLSLTLWEHYDYSRDETYLRQQAYPVLRDAAIYILDNLFDDGIGHLVSGPSLSPENSYYTAEHKKASLDVSPTMDVEITTALFRRVIEGSKLLNADSELRERLSTALAKLLPLQVGRYGQLQEWRQDYEEVEPGHRHLSHLFGVFPDDQISSSTPELYKAARVSLERRLANGGGGTGWSRAWVVCPWAAFHEAEKADESLRILFTRSTWTNLFDLHPPGVFQIDGNLGATAGIAHMLLQSHGNTLELLPALPSGWRTGSVIGLRARGDLTVDLTWRDGLLKSATLHAGRGGQFEVKTGTGLLKKTSSTVMLKAGESKLVPIH